jgi:hypothetical protein
MNGMPNLLISILTARGAAVRQPDRQLGGPKRAIG